MKLKYYIASILILTILISIGNCVATDNNETTASDATQISIEENSLISSTPSDDNSENIISDTAASDSDTDLSVDMTLGDITKHTYGINTYSFDVPLIITAKVSESTAKNTRIYLTIPDDFEYVSHEANLGSYNSTTGIWNIGDLSSTENPKLTIMTKISKKGTYSIEVNGTTDSNDINLSNNDLTCNIEVSSKISSNTTRTSADQGGAQHTSHYGSSTGGGYVDKIDDDNQKTSENPSDTKTEESKNTQAGQSTSSDSSEKSSDTKTGQTTSSSSKSDKKSNSESGDSSTDSKNSVAKQIDSNIFTKTIDEISDTANNIFNPASSSNDDDSDNPKGAVKAIDVYDYTQIPLIIFGLLIVSLIGIFAYDKIKS